jgi:hypothetical protein
MVFGQMPFNQKTWRRHTKNNRSFTFIVDFRRRRFRLPGVFAVAAELLSGNVVGRGSVGLGPIL